MTDEPVTRRWLAELAWLPGQGVCRDVLIEAVPDVPGELSRTIRAALG